MNNTILPVKKSNIFTSVPGFLIPLFLVGAFFFAPQLVSANFFTDLFQPPQQIIDQVPLHTGLVPSTENIQNEGRVNIPSFSEIFLPSQEILKQVSLGVGLISVTDTPVRSALTSRESLPGDIFHPVKILGERTRVVFSASPETKAKLEVEFAGERIKEIEKIINEKGTANREKEIGLAKRFLKQNLNNAVDLVSTKKKKGEDVTTLAKELNDTIEDSEILFTQILTEEKQSLKNKKRSVQDQITLVLQADDDEELERELSSIILLEDQIEREIEEIKEVLKSNRNLIAKEMKVEHRAQKLIKDARDEKQKLVDTFNKKGIELPLFTLDEFSDELLRSQSFFDTENFEEAERLAQNAKENLVSAQKTIDELVGDIVDEQKEAGELIEKLETRKPDILAEVNKNNIKLPDDVFSDSTTLLNQTHTAFEVGDFDSAKILSRLTEHSFNEVSTITEELKKQKQKSEEQIIRSEKERSKIINDATQEGVDFSQELYTEPDTLLLQAQSAFEDGEYKESEILAQKSQESLEDVKQTIEKIKEENIKHKTEAEELLQELEGEKDEIITTATQEGIELPSDILMPLITLLDKIQTNIDEGEYIKASDLARTTKKSLKDFKNNIEDLKEERQRKGKESSSEFEETIQNDESDSLRPSSNEEGKEQNTQADGEGESKKNNKKEKNNRNDKAGVIEFVSQLVARLQVNFTQLSASVGNAFK